MRFFYKGPDGGPESPVTGFWLVEIKGLFSVVLLRFSDGARTAFHTHAFNALTWFLGGNLMEERFDPATGDGEHGRYRRRLLPKFTPRALLHRVRSRGTSWALSVRGPWRAAWQEWTYTDGYTTLTHGREVIGREVDRG